MTQANKTKANKANKSRGEIKIQSSILARAVNNDSEALFIMFEQFIPENEQIHYTQYLGRKGLWFIGMHSFVCLTERRVADLSVSSFGEIIYQDGYLEFLNSGIIYQPSKLGLYLIFGFWLILAFIIAFFTYTSFTYNYFFGSEMSIFFSIIVFFLLMLFTPFIVKAYYGLVKCGIVFSIREGVPIYIFSNRRYLKRVNLLCRRITSYREKRLKDLR